MDRQQYIYLITETYFETKNPVASEPAEPMFELQMSLFRQILIRKQKVAEREDFITKDEFFLQCELALNHIKEFVSMQSFMEINRLKQYKKDLENQMYLDEYGVFDIVQPNWEAETVKTQFEIDNFEIDNYLVDLSGLNRICLGKICNYEVEFLDEIIKNIDTEFEQLQKPEAKKRPIKSLLLDGRELNLSERFKIANKVLDIDNKIRTLNIKDLDKYQLLAYILGCDKDNARNIMNGTYNSKDRDLTAYFEELNLKK